MYTNTTYDARLVTAVEGISRSRGFIITGFEDGID